MKFLIFCSLLALTVFAKKDEEESNTFQGQKLSWKEDDGLEIKIIRPISEEKCTIKSQAGDTVDQFYQLHDAENNVIGSNFGKKPYNFKLGDGQVIAGMDRAMTGMCIGEKRKVIIPGKLGFGDAGRDRDNIKTDQTLYYTVQLVDIFRPVPGPSWKEDDGLEIEVTHKIESDACKKSAVGDFIHQQYTLHLADGTFVDSSFSRNEPFKFKLGAKQVIAGMDRAMTGMCEGEKRKVVIPPALGYGTDGRPPQIPGNATLYFDIELEKLIKKDEL
uniref:peptidylprolyl isomerase n=1 Tax=Panagrolaimus superbus TaxID=310955 RepID=A0A914Y4F0_9BILA